MFCMNCGKKIDDDSKFCPFCGSDVGGTTQSNEQTQRMSMSSQIPSMSAVKAVKKPISKNAVIGMAACLVAVLAVIGVIKLLTGGFGKTFAEQLFQMSWTEIAELDDKELKSALRDEEIDYEQDRDNLDIYTKSASSFMGYDCYLEYTTDWMDWEDFYGASFIPTLMFGIVFETENDYKDAKDDILKYLDKNLVKGYDVVTEDWGDNLETNLYLVDISTDGLDKIEEMAEDLSEGEVKELQETLGNCKMYKFSRIYFVVDYDFKVTDVLDSDIKDCPEYGYVLQNIYMPMTDEDLVSFMASRNYDVIDKKEIDLVEVSKEIDVDLLDEEVQDSDDYLRAIYFVEHHGIDIMSGMDVSSDELKKIWYLKNFRWDNEEESFVNLMQYSNNKKVYFALTYNYDIERDTYFEDEFERAVYLAEQNYNADTGKVFESEDEKRLYFLMNYSYDIFTKKVIDKEIVDTLSVYADYIEEVFAGDEILGYNLIYIDDNDVPECLVWTKAGADNNSECRVFVLSYKNDNIESVTTDTTGWYADVLYSPRSGDFRLETSIYRWYKQTVFTLDDSFHKVISMEHESLGVDSGRSVIDEQEVSDEEYDKILSQYDYLNSYTRLICGVQDASGENFYATGVYSSLLDAYDALRTTTYKAYAPEVAEFELKDGTLTLTTQDPSNGGSIDSEEVWHNVDPLFSISYPVAEDCTWEYGHDEGGFVLDEYGSFETMKEDVIADKDEIYSPFSLYIEVIDNVVVRVYSIQS